MIENLLLIVHLVMAVALVALVLLQQGKGAQAGAAFGGGGSSQSLFGARGSANFLTRTTAVVATVFFITTLTLAYLYSTRGGSGASVMSSGSVVDQVEPAVQAAPETDVPVVPTEQIDSPTDGQADQQDVPQVDVPAVPE